MSTSPARIPWQEVLPLPPVNGALEPHLEIVDSLHRAWKESVQRSTHEEFAEARQRSLRRHAIETGIIERLYDLDWGVTEALVAEGITLEVAEREGGIDEDALQIITSQFDALQFLTAASREGRELSPFFVCDLHRAITRWQGTYEARSALGQIVNLPLHHGDWKLQPNHVLRDNNTILEYVPPEQVVPQMERLVELYPQTAAAHPVIRAAWLHHRFILIHPFEDGNGRVARALVLLVLLRADYAPLVVDRTRRADYLRALDEANDGDLSHLVRLFAELEIIALRSELERPARKQVAGDAVGVARALAERLTSIKYTSDQQLAARTVALADEVHRHLQDQLSALARDMQNAFADLDSSSYGSAAFAAPTQPEAKHWYAQIVRTAKALDFYTNLGDGSWWARLRLKVLDQEMRYVAVIQKVGRGETGVLALTAFAESVPPRLESDDDLRLLPTPLFDPGSGDSVTLTSADSLDKRRDEIDAFIDRTLAAAVTKFARGLG